MMCHLGILISLFVMEDGGFAFVARDIVHSRPCTVLPSQPSLDLTLEEAECRSGVECGMGRRAALGNLVATISGMTWFANVAQADEETQTDDTSSTRSNGNEIEENRRPRSPLESLLPAVKFRRVLDKAIMTVEKASKPSATREEQLVALDVLADLLLTPQNYTTKFSPVPKAPGRQYLEAYRRNREKLSLLEQPGALLFENGEIDTWRRLKRQERAREEIDEVRAALNAYTNDLSFRTDQYVFNESKELKSKLIREDRLPDVKQVITSDLGLRYLYRNNVLDAMEEARAELRFLQKDANSTNINVDTQPPPLDLVELKRLLSEADQALEKWFSLIDEQDVRNAKAAL